MMLSSLLTLAIAASEPSSIPTECRIEAEFNSELDEALESGGADILQGHDELCAFLEERGLAIVAYSHSGVLDGRAYAWIALQLTDRETGAPAGGYNTLTDVTTPADTRQAKKSLVAVAREALKDLAENPSRYVWDED